MTPFRVAIPDVGLFADRLLESRIAELGVVAFEAAHAAAERQEAMLPHLARFVFRKQAEHLVSHCRAGRCHLRTCPAACHFASRLHRAEVVLSETAVFRRVGGSTHFFTLVPSLWQLARDRLAAFKPNAAAGMVERALRSLKGPPIVASFNLEVAIWEGESEAYWAPHIHGLVAGPSRDALRTGLRELVVGDRNYRPLVIKPVPASDVAVLLNYSTKRVDRLKVRYHSDDRGRRRRELPMRPRDQAIIDAWRCDRQVDALHHRIGFKRNGQFLIRA